MPHDLLSPPLLLACIALIVGIAAFAHGVIGVGFPLITTPCIALLTDLKTAVLITVLPNILLNILSILRGGNWRDSLLKHWRLAAYVLLGSLVGTQLLIGLPAEPLKLALALMMLVSINLNRLKKLDWSFLRRHRRTSEAAFGLIGGILSGTVNVSVPPLAIYFIGLDLSPVATVQLFNLCFIVGKLTQAGTLAAHGEFTAAILWQSAGLIRAGRGLPHSRHAHPVPHGRLHLPALAQPHPAADGRPHAGPGRPGLGPLGIPRTRSARRPGLR